MTIDEFLDKLEGVRPSGNGFIALCPGHEDSNPSLGVHEGDDGRVLITCHAGCERKHIVEAMGLPWPHALFPARANISNATPDAVYQYTDEEGNVLFEQLRFGTGEGKRFLQRHYDPDHPDAKENGYVNNTEGVRRVVFRLPELIRAVAEGKTIYIVEGEKDALRITQETGRFATCNPFGAMKWREEYVVHFLGAKRVFIIQDRDEPGRRHANKIRDSLLKAGVPEVVIWQAKQGRDISEHFDAGLKMEDLERPRKAPKRGIVTIKELIESGLEYLQMRPQDLPGWELIPGVEASAVRAGRSYAYGAYTGDGKTSIALQGARAVCQQGARVGYFSMEMSETDLRNRLVAHFGVPMWFLERPWEMHQRPELLALYKHSFELMADWHLDIIYDTQLTVERVIEDTVDREYDFVILDHIHRVSFGDRRDLEEKIKQLTNLTLDVNIPMLILCQLRRYQRGKDMASYPPPVLQDFRETEVLGNEASIAAAVWRQRDPEGLRYIGTQSQFRVLKNRHTTNRKDRAGHVEVLDFDSKTQLFTPGGITSISAAQEELPVEWEDSEETDDNPWG